jgi:branched-chain amino acid transport system ATP-binding protein
MPISERLRMHSSRLLNLENVSVHYAQAPALREISMHINEGEIVTLLGANGAGKTSTLRAISGLVGVSGGSITFRNEPLISLSAAKIVQRGISHVPEGRRVFPRLSVRDNLELGGYRLPRPEMNRRIDNMYASFPILEARANQMAATLSGGEQQMLAIARALMAAPKLLLLDEPSLGLAPITVQSLFRQLKAILETGITILLVEQNARLALDTADRAYVIERGEIVCAGTAAEVAADERVFKAYLGGDDRA